MRQYRECSSKEIYYRIVVRDKQELLWLEVSAVAGHHRRPLYGLPRDEKNWLGISFDNGGLWELIDGEDRHEPHVMSEAPGASPFKTLYLPNFLWGGGGRVSYGLYIMKDDDDYFWASQVKAVRKDYGEMLERRHFRCDQLDGLLEYMRKAEPF